MGKIRLGVIGVGNMGKAHINNIIQGKCPEIEVTAVSDISPDSLNWARENISDVPRFALSEELMDSKLIDSVLITTPHYDHPELAISAFGRGLNVMIEKPSGVYTAQVREMNRVAAKTDVVFGIMYNQRTDHVYRKMREIIKSGELGEIRRTSWIVTDWYRPQAYYDSGGWRAKWKTEGGGVLLNQCPHNFDLWQWICGMPKTVCAHLHFGKWRDIEVEDDATAYVEYENGATGIFVTTTGDPTGVNRFEITLSGGKLLAENGKLIKHKLCMPENEFTRVNKEPYAVPESEVTQVETDGRSEQHPEVLNAFAGAVLHGKPLIAKGEEGINGLTISNAMHLSAWTGKSITLPLDEELFYSELKKRI